MFCTCSKHTYRELSDLSKITAYSIFDDLNKNLTSAFIKNRYDAYYLIKGCAICCEENEDQLILDMFIDKIKEK